MHTLAITWADLAVRVYLVSFLLNLATIPAILLSPKAPQGKLGWILVVLGLPGLGFLLYWIAGRGRLQRKVLLLRHGRASYVEAVERPFRASLHRGERAGHSRDLVRTAEVTGAFPPYPGNELTLLTDGPVGFAAVIEAIACAEDHVHLETYIFKDDRTGGRVVEALAAAAARGVAVRLLYDSWGSHRTADRLFEPLRRAGGHVCAFLPVGLFRLGWRINLRNHRKIIVIDGHTAFTGGMNIADEYAEANRWCDVHARIRGPAALGLQRVFLEDWQFASQERIAEERYFLGAMPHGDVPVQVVPGGPEPDSSQMEDVFFASIAGARRRVDIMTPYFVPPEPILAAIRAALLRGVPVRLLVPGQSDQRLPHLAMEGILPRLMARGLTVWLYPGMLHGKVLVVDDAWGTLGSANMDARSLRLNYELNVAFPHPPTALALRLQFDRLVGRARALVPEELDFGLGGRLLRNAAGLLSPIL